ncbi:hypothetical protein N7478_008103 [Penicillium angulare]|uniref:uncharacterized protein n=1 Tax=Penicillium angulare TaxID=116970 RepID=UPI0025402E83|nr:uncharacterized protein N7478_008103 [Penicillium angulare]KAJ5272978.1 hypothetical protein N7478_008103 [Penicillium angulare]
MSTLEIPDDLLREITGKTIVITGGSSGIGKATADLCIKLGALVVIGDITPPPNFEATKRYKFLKVDVSIWESIRGFFAQAKDLFGRIDHVFVNAGVAPTTDFLNHTLDSDGNIAPPNLRTINVNLIGAINTVWLATYYLQNDTRESSPAERSIVLTASASSFQNFRAADYTTAKHGVLGILRGLVGKLEGKVRINAIAPSWTATGLIPPEPFEALGVAVQNPKVVARSVVFLFASGTRHGDLIYSRDGIYLEINRATGGLLENTERLLGGVMNEDEVYRRIS